ncbi:MAG: sigma 54-interacting transcriptional regulator [Candidatus Binatia bacterium]
MNETRTPSLSLPDDTALRDIVQGVEAETGDRFFFSLVRHLASALAVQYAFVSELSDDRQRFRTRAVWGRGRFLPNLEIPVVGTPCEDVLGGQMSHHPDRLQELFPDDTGLADWGVVSYCGVPLLDSEGQPVGHLAIFDDKPMVDPRGIPILRIFAARARAEIDRLTAEAALRTSEQRLARILDSAMDAIVTFDADRRIHLFNAAAEKVFRRPADQAIGRPLDWLLTSELRTTIDRAVAAAVSGDLGSHLWAPAGVTARRADGEEFSIEATLSHVDVGGRTLYTVILRDIDERRQAEAELRRLGLQNAYLQEEIRAVHNVDEIVGQSRALADVLEKVRLVAGTDSSVLIFGETGSGKELVARAVHSNSPRRSRPLIKVNCAALPAGLIESELFGHEKGAFTGATERRIGRFELAHRGTIFLDEIGEMSQELQTKLLRVLQEQEFERVGGRDTIRVDVRVVAATNRDLTRAVADGTFRRDLYYRLNVFPVRLPPLRERPEDIPLLVHYFVQRFAAKIGRKISHVSRATLERLGAYEWPGNVRELENVIERAVILSPGPDLEVGPEVVTPAPGAAAPRPAADSGAGGGTTTAGLSLEEVERTHIVSVLKRTGWRIDGPNGAARLLDVHPSTLRSRMKKFRIQRSIEGLS